MPATATAIARSRPDPAHGRVPVEWIGRARLLRDRIAAAHVEWVETAGQLTAPLQPRDGFSPTFTNQTLALTAARWTALPERWGRLRPVVAQNDGAKLTILEMRCVPFRLTMAGWAEDELAVATAIVAVGMALPSTFMQEIRLVAAIGLHALARRFERGDRRDDLAVVRDLLPIGQEAPRALEVGGDFEVACCNGGKWAGAVMFCDDRPMLAVRTFVA
jgi:hypothetical protein